MFGVKKDPQVFRRVERSRYAMPPPPLLFLPLPSPLSLALLCTGEAPATHPQLSDLNPDTCAPRSRHMT